MFVPFISQPRQERLGRLYRRKGGGGRGGGGGGGKTGGGKSGGGSGGSSGGGAGSHGSSSGPSSGPGRSAPISSGGSGKSATPYGAGGGPSSTIPSGQAFAGRESGGGTRGQVYGNQQYGSGYPGRSGRGVSGLGFPFVFWPLAWGGAGAIGAGAYLHTSEYGRPQNASRPGGPIVTASFSSNTQNTTYRLLADNTTVTSLITDIQAQCSGNLAGNSSSVPSAYNDSFSALPQPEQAIQYYRASSVALSLDGYNNTGVLGPVGTPNTPLPTNIDLNLLNCLNQTIGAAVPLVDAGTQSTTTTVTPTGVPTISAGVRWASPNMGLIFGLFWVFWYTTSLV